MAWTPKENSASIYSGPFLVAKGAAGSEESVGEIRELSVQEWQEWADITAGTFFGTETVIDQVCIGVRATASFLLMQTFGDKTMADPARVVPNSTLSAGSTSKSMTWDVGTMCGKLASDSAVRWVFHKYSITDLTDYTYDHVFPKAIVYFAPEEYSISGADGAAMVPCMLVAFPDASDDIIVHGINAA
jgi:hypothetical protein